MTKQIFKVNDIVYFLGNVNNLGIVLEVNFFKSGKENLKINRGWKISNTAVFSKKGNQLVFKSDKLSISEAELIKNRLIFKEQRKQEKHINKGIIKEKPYYKKSFRNFCYEKNFVKSFRT